MKRTFALVILSVSMLTGCYTSICPTYSVNPEKADELKVEKTTDQVQEIRDKAS